MKWSGRAHCYEIPAAQITLYAWRKVNPPIRRMGWLRRALRWWLT